MTHTSIAGRALAVRRGQWLTWTTLGYNSLEGLLSIGAGLLAGSVALTGFGFDSAIEVGASLAAVWRLRADAHAVRRQYAERRALTLIGLSFVALAIYVGAESVITLVRRQPPQTSAVGIGIAIASLVVMPLLARAKRRVATQLSSAALRAEARQTDICMYLSAILLAGLTIHELRGWWWADSLAGLAMTPLIAREGYSAFARTPGVRHLRGLVTPDVTRASASPTPRSRGAGSSTSDL